MGIQLAADQWASDDAPTLLPPALLAHPSLRLLLDLYLEASLPWTLPVDLSEAPIRISHDEVSIETPGDRYGQAYHRRILEVSGLYDAAPDLFGITPDVPQLRVRVSLTDRDDPRPWADFRRLRQQEVRGKLCVAHLYDVATADFEAEVFVGYYAVHAIDRYTADLILTADDPGRLRDLAALEVSRHFPAAPERDRGQMLARGWGIGRHVPLRCTKGRTDETTLVQRGFTVNAGTDRATITAHGLGEGDGPFRVSSTGTLPGGLEAEVDYWIAESDANSFQFARDPSSSELVIVDLLDTGTGTHTLTSGVAPQLDDHWDFTCCGTVAIDAVYQEGEKALAAEYTILRQQTQVFGRYGTTVRFRDDPGRVTAHVQRIYPDATDTWIAAYFWDQGLAASVGPYGVLPAAERTLGATTLGSSALRAGITGIGIGAVTLNGTDDYLETVGGLPASTTFTCAVWFWWDGTTGEVVTGPKSLQDGADVPSWQVTALATGALAVGYRTGDSVRATFVSADGLLRPRAWNAAVYVVTPAEVVAAVNGTDVIQDAFIGMAPIDYGPTDRGLVFGAPIAPGDSVFSGHLGAVILDAAAWDARQRAQFYYRGRRSPVEAAREAEGDAGEPVEPASWDAAAAAVDAVIDGGLRCDGWVTEPLDLRALRERFAIFRQFQYGRTGTGQVTLRVLERATEIVAAFGLDDDVSRNVVALRSVAPASLAEAVRTLPVACRLTRDPITGEAQGFQHVLTRDVHVVGTAGATLSGWFLWDTLSADIVACLRANLMRDGDEVIGLTVAHEGRRVRASQVYRVRIPDIGADLRDLRCLRAVRSVHTADLDGYAYRTASFDYTPKPLPPEPPVPVLTALDLGDAVLEATRSGAVVTVRVVPVVTATCLPVERGSIAQGTPVGGTYGAVLADGSDSTYVETAGISVVTAALADPVLPTSTGLRVAVTIRARSITGTGGFQFVLVLAGVSKIRPTIHSLTTTPAEFTETWDTSPFTGVAWTLAELNALEAGAVGTAARVLRVAAVMRSTLDVSTKLGRVQWHRSGPGASPGLVAETAPVHAIDTALALTDYIDTTSGNHYWYQADVYDDVGPGRLVAQLGPLDVAVP